MFDGVSNFVNSTDRTFLFTLIVSVFFLALNTFLMIYFVIRYNRKRHPKGKNVHGHVGLEITWTAIPTILVLILFWFGWQGYEEMVDVPEGAMPIDVTAQMWKWSFKYENGRNTDTLYVPVNTAVKLTMHSNDVNHAFFIPAFRIKKDVYPNRERIAWFIAEKTGRYPIACAEYCGLNHSHMYSRIVVMSQQEFDKWNAEFESKDSVNVNDMNN
ncbi:MAG: cytochrome c oxidase subunit II [Ignavibacteriaceae bacterium]